MNLNGLRSRGALYALLAAFLFGASTPAAKYLLHGISPWLLAGILYMASGIGLLILRLLVTRFASVSKIAPLRGMDWGWIALATCFGGLVAPVLLMAGLARTDAATASLLLNLEGFFTAILAWLVFKEPFSRHVLAGGLLILSGGFIISWSGAPSLIRLLGPLFIVGACTGWALDNNFTNRIAASDALQIAMVKGLFSGGVNILIALKMGQSVPSLGILLPASIVGFLGYGVSLLFFVLALRHMGAARTGAYFSLAPFVGATISVIIGMTPLNRQILAGGLLMGAGVAILLMEKRRNG